MAASLTKANVVDIFTAYNKINGNPPVPHNAETMVAINTLLGQISTLLTAYNTDNTYNIALTQPKVTIVPYSNGIRPYKVMSGQAISYTIATTGGENTNVAVAFSANNLPGWLTLNSSTGALTGTAPALSSSTLNSTRGSRVANVSDVPGGAAMISAINGFGQAVNGPYPFIFEVVSQYSSAVTSAATASGVHAGAFSAYTITGNTPTDGNSVACPPLSFVAYDLAQLNAGATPGTVALNPTTGVISGNLGSGTGSPAAGTYTIYVAVINAYGEGVDKAVTVTLS